MLLYFACHADLLTTQTFGCRLSMPAKRRRKWPREPPRGDLRHGDGLGREQQGSEKDGVGHCPRRTVAALRQTQASAWRAPWTRLHGQCEAWLASMCRSCGARRLRRHRGVSVLAVPFVAVGSLVRRSTPWWGRRSRWAQMPSRDRSREGIRSRGTAASARRRRRFLCERV